jgi:hypothetical protein
VLPIGSYCIQNTPNTPDVNSKYLEYTGRMAAKGRVPVNLNFDPTLLERIDKFRHKQMYATRSEAVFALIEAGLKVNPEKPKKKAE